jgi:thiosulfate/3-mercaptopyruvate sulfurtransferase
LNLNSTFAQTVASDASQEFSPLISVSALAEKIDAEAEICLIEIGQNRERYDQGHIRGAHFLHWIDDIIDRQHSDRYNIVDQASLEKLLGRIGVSHDSRIVIYDRFSSRLSTRMYWTLKRFGHDNVQVLDGGFSKWSKEQSVTKAVPKIEPKKYVARDVQDELSADAQRVEELVRSFKGTLIDGRPLKQYTGEKPGAVFHTGKLHQQKGHIPGAVSIPWKENLKPDGTFKSARELKEMYLKRGMKPEGPVITYCNEGLHAALPWFVASAILERENVSLYDDSMAEWANSNRPVEAEAKAEAAAKTQE